MADEASYHGTVLLLNPGLVVAAVGSGPGELDAAVGAVCDQRFVDERAVVIGVDAKDGKGQLLRDGLQPLHNQRLLPGQEGYRFGPASANVGCDQTVDE